MKLTTISKVLAAVAIPLSFLATVPSAFAGECKVSRPSDDVLADASNMTIMNERALGEIAFEYEKANGKSLEIVIVARAGQDLGNQIVLRDVMGKSPLTLENIYKAAYNDPDARAVGESGNGAPDYNLVKNVIGSKFKDPERALQFSHVGFMIRNHPNAPELKPGQIKMWRARHMLRPCLNKNPITEFEKIQQRDLNVPYLWDEGQFNFFADNPYELKIRYIVPVPELQARLLEAVFDEELIYTLNSRFYNAAANYKNVNESNSNQWVLEVLAAATRPKSQVQTRADAQAVLVKMNYTPTKILFSGKQAYINMPGASKVAPYVTYHSKEQPFYFRASIGEVISALSVEEFMDKNGLMYSAYETPALEKTENKRPKTAPPKVNSVGYQN